MSRGSGRRSHRPDSSLSVLLDLDGTKIGVGTQYWVKISAWVIEPDEARPHGIRYELTLHDIGNRRILGFDNAHAVKRPGGHPTKKQGSLEAETPRILAGWFCLRQIALPVL